MRQPTVYSSCTGVTGLMKTVLRHRRQASMKIRSVHRRPVKDTQSKVWFFALFACIKMCVLGLTLEKYGDNVTVHQGLDVVLCAHGKAAQYHSTLCSQLQAGGTLLEQV